MFNNVGFVAWILWKKEVKKICLHILAICNILNNQNVLYFGNQGHHCDYYDDKHILWMQSHLEKQTCQSNKETSNIIPFLYYSQ